MRRKIVAGNWKMNNQLPAAEDLLKELAASAGVADGVEKIVIPPFPFLSAAKQILENTDFKLGAQNCHQESKGAYTGEVSADMLKSVGCGYILVGHSERREFFKEDADLLMKKAKAVLESGLVPIFCVGENLEERKGNRHFEVIKQQLEASLFSFEGEDFNKLILAYEPVWAIGTGETASPEQAQEVHQFIRKTLAEKFGKSTADSVRILYGGSCKPGNAKELFSQSDVDGGLIGGASLKADDFLAIIAAAEEA